MVVSSIAIKMAGVHVEERLGTIEGQGHQAMSFDREAVSRCEGHTDLTVAVTVKGAVDLRSAFSTLGRPDPPFKIYEVAWATGDGKAR